VRRDHVLLIFTALFLSTRTAGFAQGEQRPYRLEGVDLKQRVIWTAQCLQPVGRGLAFGGQDQDADDGRAHTRLLVEGKWLPIHTELRAGNPLQQFHVAAWKLRDRAKRVRARARFIYFSGVALDEEKSFVRKEVTPGVLQLTAAITALVGRLPKQSLDDSTAQQLRFAKEHLQAAIDRIPKSIDALSPAVLKQLREAQLQLALAAEAFDAEPAARAIDCGRPRKKDGAGPPAQGLVFDTATRLYVLFGGDHLDYLTNDTWVFDPAQRRWLQRHPDGAPPPRANHRLVATGDGRVRLSGGYTYTSNTDYVGGQYIDLNDGEWEYDIKESKWRPIGDGGRKLVASDTRLYRSGPFHPDFYLQGQRPDAAKFEAWLKAIPANEWTATNPLYRPRLNRDWGTARIDSDRDMMLRWSGGHSAHGGTDVPHFHFATNRWELPFPVEFPLGQLYSNTSYPDGYNFNRRPWMTGHTYQNYAYDRPSRLVIQAGRPQHFYLYDPDLGDWVGRGGKPSAMQYNSCFYTLTLTSTPQGATCWDKNGRVHRYVHKTSKWTELEVVGDKLPGAYVDNSTICYDSKRDRLLIINAGGYGKPYSGQVWEVDLKNRTTKALSPQGMAEAHRFANVDKCCYDAANDLLLLGTYLKEAGEMAPTPAYDCANNRWVTLALKYETGKRNGNTTRAFPHRRSDGLMFDVRRKLIWGTDTNSQVYVLRLQPDATIVESL